MPSPISVTVLTYRRDDALAATLSRLADVIGTDPLHQVILVDNNADGVDRSPLMAGFANGVYVDPGYNLGVAAGRNQAIARATGDLVLFLDDDALLEVGPDFASDLSAVFEADRELAVVAFRSFVGTARVEDPIEFPHTDKSLDRSTSRATFRFIGVAHAVRRSMLDEVGPYCADFFYGMEEFDLSYRFLKLGYRIQYRPEFRVQHMKNVSGRIPPKALVRRMYANKLAVGWMHLPKRYLALSAAAWFVKTALDSRSPFLPFRAIGDFLMMVAQGKLLHRAPSRPLVAAVKACGGAPWR